MKTYLPVLTALATSLVSSPFIPSLKAGEVDKKTIITISQPVAVEGTTLPAGQYVLKLQEDQSSRNIVRIFDNVSQMFFGVGPMFFGFGRLFQGFNDFVFRHFASLGLSRFALHEPFKPL